MTTDLEYIYLETFQERKSALPWTPHDQYNDPISGAWVNIMPGETHVPVALVVRRPIPDGLNFNPF